MNENFGQLVNSHFAEVGKMVEGGVDVECNFSLVGKIVETGIATKEIDDYKLSRYACFLIAQKPEAIT